MLVFLFVCEAAKTELCLPHQTPFWLKVYWRSAVVLEFLHRGYLNTDYSLKRNEIPSLTTLLHKQSIRQYFSKRGHKGTVDSVFYSAPDVQQTTISMRQTHHNCVAAVLILGLALLINDISRIINLPIFNFQPYHNIITSFAKVNPLFYSATKKVV